jgi:hypothetical protein
LQCVKGSRRLKDGQQSLKGGVQDNQKLNLAEKWTWWNQRGEKQHKNENAELGNKRVHKQVVVTPMLTRQNTILITRKTGEQPNNEYKNTMEYWANSN